MYRFWASKLGQKRRKRGFTKRARGRILSNMDERGRYKGGRARLRTKVKGVKGRGRRSVKAYFARYKRR